MVHGVLDLEEAPLEGGTLLGPHRLEHQDPLLELFEALRRIRKGDSVRGIFHAVPARPETHDEASAAHVIERRGDLGEQRRSAEGHRRDRGGDPDPLGPRGDGGEDGEAFELRGVGGAERGEEMVVRRHRKKALRLCGLGGAQRGLDITSGQKESEFHLVHGSSSSGSAPPLGRRE